MDAQETQQHADALLAAVNKFAEAVGLAVENMPIVDVAVICGQRGFNQDGGISRVVTLVPTDTAQYAMMGLIRDAQVEYDRRVWNSLGREEDE